MRYLFIHPVFPGQFHQIIEKLAQDKNNQILHICRQSALEKIPNVQKITYKLPADSQAKGHTYVHKLEEAVFHGQVIAKVLNDLKAQGFTPDIIYSYAGWGHNFFIKDIYPNTPLVGYFEWFLNAFGSEYHFDPEYPISLEHQYYLRLANTPMLLDLQQCDYGITPTEWQRSQFPVEFQRKIHVCHDGINSQFFQPSHSQGLQLGELQLPANTPILTYATRGMEPFRGFPQFMRAVAQVQQHHKSCHTVIVGSEAIYYSKPLANGLSYKQQLLADLKDQLDLSRLHFVGWLDKPDYLKILQASWAHVYLTRPYVLSWSLMEALATGCVVIGSDTAPVSEMIRHQENGLLVDFFAVDDLATQILHVLNHPHAYQQVRRYARQTITERYEQDALVNQQIRLLQRWTSIPLQRR